MSIIHSNIFLKTQNPFKTIPAKTPPITCLNSLSQPKLQKTHIQALSKSSSSSSIQKPQESTTSTSNDDDYYYKVEFKTMGGCKLGISRYPDFEYDAQGGFGSGSGKDDSVNNGMILVDFDVAKLYIPPLTSESTKFLGLPLPPFLRIDIVPEIFKGSIHKQSGKVELEFRANFWFTMGTLYKAPPLLVSTMLTSEESQGKLRKGRGQRIDEYANGNCKLVGVAKVDPIQDIFMDSFLGLPTECLAILNATISISQLTTC